MHAHIQGGGKAESHSRGGKQGELIVGSGGDWTYGNTTESERVENWTIKHT